MNLEEFISQINLISKLKISDEEKKVLIKKFTDELFFKNSVNDSNNSFILCKAYNDKDYNEPVCYGVSEIQACSCKGNKMNCNFYKYEFK